MTVAPIQVIDNIHSKWITESTILQCFTKGKRHVVDKILCGSGFTFAYLKMRPPINATDVLIEVNVQVCKDKEIEYKKGLFGTQRMLFLYQGSGNYFNTSMKYDKVITVVNSFNHNFNDIKRLNVRHVLTDEQHSLESAANGDRKHVVQRFNKNLNILEKKGSIISSVTATPNLFANVTIKIDNGVIPESNLYMSFNSKEAIGRVVEKIKRNEQVFIFTQNAGIIVDITKQCDITSFNLRSGDNMKATLCKKGKFRFVKDSNVTFITSSGFEGWSSYLEGASAFVFASYDNDVNSFLWSNIYQSLNRLRKGGIYNELCIFEGTGRKTKYIPLLREAVKHYVNSPIKATHKQRTRYEFKMGGKTYKGSDLSKFVLFSDCESGGIKIEPVEDAINNHLEKYSASLGFEKLYKNHFLERGVTLRYVNEADNGKLKGGRNSIDTQIAYLLDTLPHEMDLVERALYPSGISGAITDIKGLEKALRINIGVRSGLGLCYANELAAVKFINRKDFNQIILTQYLKDAKKKGVYSEKQSLEWFKENDLTNKVLLIIYDILRQYTFSKKRGFREFSAWTDVSNGVIDLIVTNLGLELTELDIPTAFPRLLFTMFGKDVPIDFYGENRSKNKVKVNTLLNSLSTYSADTHKRKELKKGRKISIKAAKKYIERKPYEDRVRLLKWFPVEIVDYLLSEFGGKNTDSGKFYDAMTKHEREIIKKGIKLIKHSNNPENLEKTDFLLVRKHDAILCISKDGIILNGAMNMEYLNIKGWFKRTDYNNNIHSLYTKLDLVSA